MERRTFVKNTVVAAAGFAILPSSHLMAAEDKKVKVGVIGTGLRGQNHLELLLRRKDVEIKAICDIDDRMLKMASDLFKKAGQTVPQIYTGDVHAYRKLLERPDIDAVVIATPWEWHAPMSIDALDAKKYVGCEVIMGITMEDHWNVVKACERNQGHLMMLENVCYRRDVLAVLNMVRQNLFGEIIHLQGGYQHDLRGVKFNNGVEPYDSGAEFGPKAFSEARWRTVHSEYRNGDLYPTHGMGPLAKMTNITRGNRFLSLNSFSTKSRGLHQYVEKMGGKGHPNAKVSFQLGDIVTTQLRCSNGETILLQHDTNLPRPYSLGFRVQGTAGIWMDVNQSIYIEGTSPKHQWEAAKTWLDKYDHPLWKRWAKDTENAGHGGMDFFVLHSFIESIKRKKPFPIDVYDSVTWSAITPLSEKSIELGNETVEFPDFTSGTWMYRTNDFALNDEY